MLRQLCVVTAVAGLIGCGDPLAELDSLSEVDLAESDPVAAALPSEAEVSREGYFGTEAASPAQNTLAQPTAPKKQRGLFGIFRPAATNVPPKDPASPSVPSDAADVESAIKAAEASVSPSEPQDGNVVVAALEPTQTPKKTGLFGRRVPGALTSTQAADVTDVAYGTVLPYGVIARSCEARRKPLGRKIESATARGYKLYDSDPDSTGPRTYYITGFADDCPRQLTAANVLLGAPSRYEQLHYGPTGKDLAYGETDKAYDKVKQKVCGVRKGKPCGKKIAQLDRSTFFVTSYQSFGANARWSEVLIHKGIVLARAMKTNG